MHSSDEPEMVLAVPRLRVQNANCVSSPITWGFPSPTALVGLGEALHRCVRARDLAVRGVGVVCHHFDPQIARRPNEPSLLRLTRNPMIWKGGECKPAALIEEGRAHLDVSLLFGLSGPALYRGDQAAVVAELTEELQALRFAGGVFVPPDPRGPKRTPVMLEAGVAGQKSRDFVRRLLPGFALVSREAVLAARTAEMRSQDASASSFDALLELARLHHDCARDPEDPARGHWSLRRRKGWLVPITCGFRALSPLSPPGAVPGTRDDVTPFRLVEAIYTAGEWLSPHRVSHPADLLWYPRYDTRDNTYHVTTPYYADDPGRADTTNRSD